MTSPQDLLFESLSEKLVQIPTREALERLRDRQLSNLILVVQEGEKELETFIETIRAVQMAREDERIEASTVVS
jgi:hypothetical protein